MPFGSVKLVPGINVERTPTLLETGYSSSSLIRFKDSLAQKYGGWEKYYAFAVSGVPRDLHPWQDLSGDDRLAVGTTSQLALITSGALADITPQQILTNNYPAVTTVSGSSLVEINDVYAEPILDNDQYTKIMLHFDGADGSTVITDTNTGGSSHTWTANGDAQLDTAQKKFGISSLLCDGTGDYVTTADNSDYALSTNDFTIDFWFNCQAATGDVAWICGQTNSAATAATTSFRIQKAASDKIAASAYEASGSTQRQVVSTTLYTNLTNTGWHHLALVRSNGTMKLYLDGVSEGTPIAVGSVIDSSSNLSVGRLGDFANNPWHGWIDDFRFTNGAALWTSNFTPPTATAPTVTTDYSIILNTPVTIGGLLLWGVYPVYSVTGTNTYKIDAGTNATSSSSTPLLPVFTSTSGSSLVSVNITAHGLVQGNKVVFQTQSMANGVTIYGHYTVASVTDANNFSISVNTQATASGSFTMNEGMINITYNVAIGPPAAGAGYGLGGYGEGGYGTGTTVSSTTGTPIAATDWTSDNWGEIYLACPFGGAVYQYDPTGGFTTAKAVETAPPFNGGIFVSTQLQILFCWGSSQEQVIGVERDPMLISWSDIGDYTQFQPSTTNQAGSFRIPIGSVIRGGMAVANQNLFWTDLDCWAANYAGFPLVFGFNKIGAGAGSISSHAMQQLRNGVYWMGASNFYSYTDGVRVLPCPVWDAVFQNLNTAYAANVRAMPNTPFNEVGWLYPSTDSTSGECDSYVKFNITEPGQPWDIGPLARSAWVDQSIVGMPIGATPTGVIYEHETTPDADGAALTASFTTGYFMIAEGEDFAFVDQILPDMKWGTYGNTGASVQISFNVIDYMGDTPTVYGPFTMNSSTEYISVRFRGRQMSVTVTSSDIGSFWRLGRIRYRWAPAGRR